MISLWNTLLFKWHWKTFIDKEVISVFKKAIRKIIYGYISAESDKFEKFSEPWKACCLVCQILSGEYKYR